ncbi:aldo/keto reductase [Luteimonas sp. RD2P54]|uniref:Aldo/keto reductase n=1 Tax=Luteimonas endophytica TaxID=3042023 RepID=A0ABT6J4X7_9GAMM|nr:aldo/keto reductase [Luteimonas endophytica]MDH5821824.1 aldo/keto reductase [Luteimonas endophytica]
MITRREYLKLSIAAGVALAISPRRLLADDSPRALLTRAIPGTSEQLPVVGLGSSASFSRLAGEGDDAAIGEILQTLVRSGGRVFDTAPSYGAAEEVAGRAAREAGLGDRLFWATKLNVAPRGGGAADPAAARAQLEQSLARAPGSPVDLVQVHNLGDVATQLPILAEAKAAGRIRYVGLTTTVERQYEQLERLMREQALDFIGVDYAVDNRTMEQRIFPLAQERGIGVLVYAPFGRTRLWEKVEGRELPDWAADYDIASWGQFFLKFVVSHPAVTCATPATSKPRHLLDNMGAASGRMPDEAGRQRMAAYIEAL